MIGISETKSLIIRSASLCLIALGTFCCTVGESEAQKDQADGQRFNVGYRIIDLQYRIGEEQKTLTVAVWYPTASPPKPHNYGGPTNGNVAVDAEPLAENSPYPLLVFSHGYGGSGLGSVFLSEALASRGWIIAAPDHNDRHTAVRIRTGQKKDFDRMGLLQHAKEISSLGSETRNELLYRLEEMKAVLDIMPVSESFGKFIDKEKIAVGGHSLGGFTALGLCGTIEQWYDNRIKAVLLFSTGAGGYLFREDELAAVRIPSMYFLGEREKKQLRGTKTMAELANKVFQKLPPPKYFMELKGASHFSFNNRFADNLRARLLSGTEQQFELIRKYSIAFLEKHVAEKNDAGGVLEHQDPLLTRYMHESAVSIRQ